MSQKGSKNKEQKYALDTNEVPSPSLTPSFFDLDSPSNTARHSSPNLIGNLIQTQAWFQSLTSQMGHWFAVAENKNNRFRLVFCSEGSFEVLGYAAGELLDKPFADYLNPDALQYIQATLQRCAGAEGYRETIEYQAQHKDGTWRILESSILNCTEDLSIGGLLITTQDITKRKEKEELLESRNAWFAGLLNQVTDTLRILDADGYPQIAIGRLNWLFGTRPNTFDRDHLLRCVHKEDKERMQEALEHLFQVIGQQIRVGFRARDLEGEWRYIELEFFNRLEDPLLQGIVITGRDLTTRKLFDSATKLPSRTLFLDRVERLLQRKAQTQGEEFAVLVIGVDRFGEVNNGLGNDVGERLLKTIGSRLVVSVRPSDYVGRLGRSQFTVLLHGMRTPADIIRICQHVHESAKQPCFLGGYKVHTTVSIGVAFSPSNFSQADQMLQAAETAMERGKGGGITEMFDPAMGEEVRERLILEGSLRYAIERKELALYYQPIVALPSRELAGFEALCRWKHAEKGFISPEQFIPIAEETGMICSIGEWVFSQACQAAIDWDQLSSETVFVSINLSGKQLEQPKIVPKIKEIVKRWRIDPARIKLEVTETALIANADDVAKTLHSLRSLGLKLSLDDFGTGYSSLNYLHQFPFDPIKIEQSFGSLLGSDTSDTLNGVAIIPTIIQLAKSLNMDVIAEGIETEEQAYMLQQMGCPYGQGYLFSRPVPKEQVTILFQQKQL